MFKKYYKAGLLCVPERDSVPLVKFSKYWKTDERPSEKELNEWDSWKGVNYGLICGQVSGVVAIDIDYGDEETINKVKKALGETPCAKFGTKGLTLFYKYNGEKSQRFGEVEVKSDRSKVTIPPSEIPAYKGDKGKQYIWIGSPLNEVVDSLPYLPINYKEKLCAVLNIIEKEPEYRVKPKNEAFFGALGEAEIEKALGYLSPDCHHDNWKAVGACLFNELGDAGFYYFDKWSSKSSKYDSKEIYNSWNGCKTFTRYTIGSLIYWAKENGFVLNEREFIQVNDRELARKRVEEEKSTLVEYPDFYLEAPAHIKAIADWMCKSAYIPQPVLSLGVACGLVGFCMFGKYKFWGVKSNMYCINVARSATGKEHILQCASGLFSALDLKGHHTGSRFSGDTAILNDLKRTKGNLCYITDEVQVLLKAISSGHHSVGDAEEIFLSAYTGKEVHGKTYANKKDTEEKGGTIKNPFMSIVGFTTPSSFYSSVGTAQKGNGLVGRLTVFEGLKILPEEPNPKYDSDAPDNPPKAVVDYLRNIIENTREVISYNGGTMVVDKPMLIQANDDVVQAIKEIEREILRERNELYFIGDTDSETALMRKVEVIKKYCLIASGGNNINIDHFNWAVKMADYNSSIMLKAAGEFGGHEFAGKVQRLHDYIKVRGRVSKSQVVNGLRIFKDADEREKAFRELLESQRITPVTLSNKAKGKRQEKGFEYIEGN